MSIGGTIMLTRVGDDELDVMELPNGMTIKMDFATSETGTWNWRGRISGKYRRIRLYDEKDNLLSELIEPNPLYRPSRPGDLVILDEDPNVIY